MKKIQPVLILAACWQVLRYILIFFGMIAPNGSGRALEAGIGAYWLLLYSAGTLVLPAGFIIVALGLVTPVSLLNLLCLGKGLELLTSLILFAVELSSGGTLVAARPFLYPVIFIAFLDLIFLIVTVTYRAIGWTALSKET